MPVREQGECQKRESNPPKPGGEKDQKHDSVEFLDDDLFCGKFRKKKRFL